MKLPRDLSGRDLIKLLKPLGYAVTRQTGSHIRLTTQEKGEHHITVPDHESLRIGTLANIFGEIADHFEISRNDLLKKLR